MATPTFILPSAPTYTEGFVNGLNVYPNPTNFVANQVPFTRATTATRTNAAGLIELVPYNLFQYSEQFDNATWNKTNASITANTTISPSGIQNADTMTDNATVGIHGIDYAGAVGVYTCSVYAKKSTSNYIGVYSSSALQGVIFNLNTGTFSANIIAAPTSYSITSVGNGWYRCTITTTTTSTAVFRILMSNDGSGFNYSGTGQTVFIWGAQLVEGTDALPYQLTETRLNRPRVDFSLGGCPNLLLEPQRTNSIRNSTMVGAVAGTPGTLPTNWSNSLVGLTQTIVGVGSEGGVNYIDFRFNGTAIGTTLLVFLDTTTSISASNGQSWTLSNYIKLVSAPSGASSYNLVMHERTIAGAYVTEGSIAISPTSTLGRFTYTRTLAGGVTVAFVQPIFRANLSIGTAYDFTIRIAAPQMELGAYPTTYIPTSSASVTRNADSFALSNVFTNDLISSAGGTWVMELRNNIPYIRDAFASALLLGTTSTLGLSIGHTTTGVSQRLAIRKFVSGSGIPIWTTTATASKIAIKWNGTTADVFENGVKVVSANSFVGTLMNDLFGSAGDVPRYINSMALYNTPLSDDECIAKTL